MRIKYKGFSIIITDGIPSIYVYIFDNPERIGYYNLEELNEFIKNNKAHVFVEAKRILTEFSENKSCGGKMNFKKYNFHIINGDVAITNYDLSGKRFYLEELRKRIDEYQGMVMALEEFEGKIGLGDKNE